MGEATRRAVLSVTDKTGLVDFARGLQEEGFEILSTGGTARVLREAGLTVTEVGEFTGFPEILGGRVKTLHPRLLGGVLARLERTDDRQDLEAHAIPAVELVVVNLYRFEEAVTAFEAAGPRQDCRLEDSDVARVIEQIDIGGPTMVRAAAKNANHVGVVVDPADYGDVLGALRGHGRLPSTLRARLAARAFRRIAEYDAAVDRFFSRYLGEDPAAGSMDTLLDGDLPAHLAGLEESGSGRGGPQVLRYGENPHQKALCMRGREPGEASVLHARLLGGKPLSYNNLLDAEGAWELVKEFEVPAAVVIKHTNPCGAAVAETIDEAFTRAYAGDPVSAFGGILACNRPVDSTLAGRIATRDHFFEVLIAPDVDDEALEVLRTGAPWGKNLRVLAAGDPLRVEADRPHWTVRSLVGGLLVQERDLPAPCDTEVPTKRRPTAEEERDLEVAWKVVKHVRSNAIVLVKDGALVGVGAGQMSRVDSVEIALRKAGDRATGAVLGSDAFFPFRDGVDAAASGGVRAVIQPGGSRRDGEVVEACNEADVAMVFTGVRHFKH